jgi:hypothetical protein
MYIPYCKQNWLNPNPLAKPLVIFFLFYFGKKKKGTLSYDLFLIAIKPTLQIT